MTPLEELIREQIIEDGAINVAGYMQACLAHPVHGYYMKQDPFGSDGDFTTAPEISQMFGELIGLWVLAGWQAAGTPTPFNLIELGPGRGTLMADALRAASAFPAFKNAVRVHMVEMSPTLHKAQEQRLADAGIPVTWHGSFAAAAEATEGPVFVIGNEFLDALPIHQFHLTEDGWREKLVALGEGGELIFALAGNPPPDFAIDILNNRATDAGAAAEFCPSVVGVVQEVAAAIRARGGLGLFIDYGHERSQPGETLQAVKGHEFVSPLKDPGEVDLTAHVDFEAVARSTLMAGAVPTKVLTQGDFLGRIGIQQRAEKLMGANPEHKDELTEALDRLTNPARMGELFKVIAIRPEDKSAPAFEDNEVFEL